MHILSFSTTPSVDSLSIIIIPCHSKNVKLSEVRGEMIKLFTAQTEPSIVRFGRKFAQGVEKTGEMWYTNVISKADRRLSNWNIVCRQ